MGALGAVVGNNDMGFDLPRLVPWSAAMAMGSPMLCGIVGGTQVSGCVQAAQMEPVEALRSIKRTMLSDIFGQALEAMQHNRRRTLITVIGMAWGIATVVLLLAYGAGFGQAFENIFAQWEQLLLACFPGARANKLAVRRLE